jgi:acyl-CoA dehydrogenase
MDFALSPELAALQARTRRFVDEVVIPAERRMPGHDTAAWATLRAELQTAAREAGLYLPQLPAAYGGLGLDWRSCAVIFEEAGRSLLGPQALNCAAPDEGNMHLLERVATPEQRERYLRPLAEGARSCFSMTEPAPGAGADPALLQTSAEPIGAGWVINGRKWFITGADGAAFSIVMARTGEVRGRDGATMFLVDAANPGFQIVRTIDTLDSAWPGGHCEIRLENCIVPAEAVLGEVGKGFEYAQVRLAPARLTHCMRWLGIARRALEYALDYTAQRDSFGARLAEQQGIQWMVADSEIEMQAARLLIWHAAWLLDQGQPARHESSVAKVFVAETVNRVVDRALQMCGALGISEDIPLAAFYREIRAFRIYDGPSEVHRLSIARRVYRRQERKGSM